jgi:hypothetical protein
VRVGGDAGDLDVPGIGALVLALRTRRAELLTGIEGASSRPVRRIVLSVRAERRGKPMTELLITVSALLLALIGCAVLNGQSRSGDTEAAVAEEQARRMQAIALSVF